MNENRVLEALIGLAGAVSNNGKTEDTDRIVCEALAFEDSEEMRRRVQREKFRISPGCESCQHPCGNTSDFSLILLEDEADEIKELKQEIIEKLREYAVNILSSAGVQQAGMQSQKGAPELPDTVYKAISYLKYSLTEASYRELLNELDEMTVNG